MKKPSLDSIVLLAYSHKETLHQTYSLTVKLLQENIPGVFIECGIAAGAQVMAMKLAMMDTEIHRPIFCFDSFEGIPLAGKHDKSQPGIEGEIKHDVSLPIAERLKSSGITVHSMESVLMNFYNEKISLEDVHFIKGWFQDTIPAYVQKNPIPIAMLRLDGDLYESTEVAMDKLYPMVSRGGIVIIDDYALEGSKKAVHDYILQEDRYGIHEPGEQEKTVAYFFKKTMFVPPLHASLGIYRNLISGETVIKPNQLSEEPVSEPAKVISKPRSGIEGTLTENVDQNFSQNNEQEIVINYFKNTFSYPPQRTSNPILVDIGANDGVTYSNSRGLMLLGWSGILIEPSPRAFDRLQALYGKDPYAVLHPIAISDRTQLITLHESNDIIGHNDVGLVSSISSEEMKRWSGATAFRDVQVQALTWEDFLKNPATLKIEQIDFLNIDAEGLDWEILKQIDLRKLNVGCWCIEHNGNAKMIENFSGTASYFGYKEIGRNAENLIFAQ